MNDVSTEGVALERWMAQSPDKLWRALTQGELLADWLMPNDFEAVVGHKFRFQAQPNPHWDGRVDGEVLEAEPQRRLSYSWIAAGGLNTVVTWTLEPENDGVRVRMEQTGFGPDQTRNLQGARYGWEQFFNGLERVAATV